MAKSIQTAVASFVKGHIGQQGRADAVREALEANDIDITSRTAVSAEVTPLIAAEYGVKLQAAERVSKNGALVFPKNAKGEAARTCRDALLRAVLGAHSGHKVEEIKVTRAMKVAAAAFIEACGSKKAALAAIKAAK